MKILLLAATILQCLEGIHTLDIDICGINIKEDQCKAVSCKAPVFSCMNRPGTVVEACRLCDPSTVPTITIPKGHCSVAKVSKHGYLAVEDANTESRVLYAPESKLTKLEQEIDSVKLVKRGDGDGTAAVAVGTLAGIGLTCVVIFAVEWLMTPSKVVIIRQNAVPGGTVKSSTNYGIQIIKDDEDDEGDNYGIQFKGNVNGDIIQNTSDRTTRVDRNGITFTTKHRDRKSGRKGQGGGNVFKNIGGDGASGVRTGSDGKLEVYGKYTGIFNGVQYIDGVPQKSASWWV